MFNIGAITRSGRVPLVVLAAVCPVGMVFADALPAAASSSYTVEMCGPAAVNDTFGFYAGAGTPIDETTYGCGTSLAGYGPQLSPNPSVDSSPGGDAANWGFRPPANTTISGLLYLGGDFYAASGWAAGWATTGSGSGDPVPGQDCNLNTISSPCSETGNAWVTVPGSATWIGFGLWCRASSCLNSGQAFASVATAYVAVSDPDTSPSISAGGPLWTQNGWISGLNAGAGIGLSFGASDPGGVCDLDATLSDASGDIVASSSQNAQSIGFDGVHDTFLVGAPCGGPNRNPTTWNPDLSQLATGTYYENVRANNPARWEAGSYGYATGSSPQSGVPLLIDNSHPSVSVAAVHDPNASGWYGSAPQSIAATANPAPNASPIASIACSGPGAPSGQQSGSQLTVSDGQQGASTIQCTSTSQAGNSSAPASVSVNIDTQTPSVSFNGGAPAPAWLSGPQAVTVTGSEPQQLSGITSVSCQVDGSAWTTTSGSVARVPLSTDGVHTIHCYSTTGAGVQGPTGSYTVQIDSVPPAIAFSNAPAQSTWATSAQSIEITAIKPLGTSGVKAIVCSIDGQTTTYPNTSTTDPDSETQTITVEPPGGDLTCKAQDNAGNTSSSQAWNFEIDNTTPTGEFLPPDPSNPTQIAVKVADDVSGVARVLIEIQTGDGWDQLPTSFDPSTGIATATIPDDGTLPDGTYQLEAFAWSVAGNVATITQAADGTAGTTQPAEVTLPLRIVTQLHVGAVQASAARAGSNTLPLDRTAALSFGQSATVTGNLQTVDGTPVAGGTIRITQQASGWNVQALGSVTTDGQGRFSYMLPAGASRTVMFSYPGTAVLRAASATTGVNVVGKGTMTVGRHAVAGKSLRITGRLYGGYIPSDGVLVQLWYRVKGIPAGFGPFDHAIHTSSNGAWSITFPVSMGARGYTYLFKAVIALQTGWPFLATSTNVVERHVT